MRFNTECDQKLQGKHVHCSISPLGCCVLMCDVSFLLTRESRLYGDRAARLDLLIVVLFIINGGERWIATD
jgi:hypothetical protein